jgi:hypothetical protein
MDEVNADQRENILDNSARAQKNGGFTLTAGSHIYDSAAAEVSILHEEDKRMR